MLEGASDHPALERVALALTVQQGEAFPALVTVPFAQSSVAIDKNNFFITKLSSVYA